ncbi:HD domain-containing protein [bacterium BFN5]|nr:HD domain-containing protein [bacterium BFN5]QJW45440.1 HD domain-containing protein [bacterium BFN5]
MKTLSIADLQPGMLPAQTIYDAKGMILIARGIPLTESYIKRLIKFNIQVVTIQDTETENNYAAVFSPIADQAATKARQLMADLVKHKTIKLEPTSYQIEQVVYSALERLPLQPYLAKMCQNDTLYNHSLRTALISANLGLAKNYDYLNLDFLVTCSILHDCGMGKDFCEDDNHTHAFKGFLEIRKQTSLDILTALVCLQHHERFDGLGAPLGFAKYQIIEFARLIAVADYYDRLVAIYHNTPRQAIFKLAAASGSLFDPDMIKLFESTLIT